MNNLAAALVSAIAKGDREGARVALPMCTPEALAQHRTNPKGHDVLLHGAARQDMAELCEGLHAAYRRHGFPWIDSQKRSALHAACEAGAADTAALLLRLPTLQAVDGAGGACATPPPPHVQGRFSLALLFPRYAMYQVRNKRMMCPGESVPHALLSDVPKCAELRPIAGLVCVCVWSTVHYLAPRKSKQKRCIWGTNGGGGWNDGQARGWKVMRSGSR